MKKYRRIKAFEGTYGREAVGGFCGPGESFGRFLFNGGG